VHRIANKYQEFVGTSFESPGGNGAPFSHES
jgi:hypothetical protein